MHSAVLVIVKLSVCLSVSLMDCAHMVRPTIMISSPYGKPMILVFWRQISSIFQWHDIQIQGQIQVG